MTRVAIALYRLRGPIYYAAVILLVVSALLRGLLPDGVSRRILQALPVAALVVILLCAVLVALGPRLLPERGAVVVTAPVHGRWLGMNSPASKVPSHGARMYGQSHAIDLVHEPVDGARPSFGAGHAMPASDGYPAFGEPVYAMVDGVVVRASGWRRDHRARSSVPAMLYMMMEGVIRELGGPGFVLGNHVVIRSADGVHAAVAHLQRGSLAVRVGQTVRAGERIGRCGNSGNSSEPHVHAQLMDRASVWTAQGIPMLFSGIGLDDPDVLLDALPRNDQHMTAPPNAPAGLGTLEV